MDCKICGHSTRTIASMAKHYRKEHPQRMERKTAVRRERAGKVVHRGVVNAFTAINCPHCGKELKIFP